MPFIIIGGLIAIFVIWGIGVQRRLVAMDENVNNAMSQIGVQLSSRFDALTALLDLAKGYAAHESQTLIETIKSRRSVITATSTPDDVLKQEGIISEALGRISMVAERYPELKASESYKKCMDAVDSYENGAHQPPHLQRQRDQAEPGTADVSHLPAGRHVRVPSAGLSGGGGRKGGYAQYEVSQ